MRPQASVSWKFCSVRHRLDEVSASVGADKSAFASIARPLRSMPDCQAAHFRGVNFDFELSSCHYESCRFTGVHHCRSGVSLYLLQTSAQLCTFVYMTNMGHLVPKTHFLYPPSQGFVFSPGGSERVDKVGSIPEHQLCLMGKLLSWS